MAYDESLANKVREALSRQKAVEEKRIFGGLAFMVNGKMCVGVLNDDLMARIAPEMHETVLRRIGCREMDFTGKPMKGFVFVGPDGTRSNKDLSRWIGLALEFNTRAMASKKKR